MSTDTPDPAASAGPEISGPDTSAALQPPVSRRPRRPPPRRSWWSRQPLTIRYGLPLVILGILVAAALDQKAPPRVQLKLAPKGALAVTPPDRVQLEFFQYLGSARDPWPPQLLRRTDVAVGELAEFLPEELPERSWVRVQGDGVGTTTRLCKPGLEPLELPLHPPGVLQDRVLDAQGRGIAGARVLATGWVPRGPVVAEGATASDGTFQLTGLDTNVPSLGLRVLAPGFAVLNRDWSVGALEQKPLVLERTVPFRGKVILPAGLTAEGLWLYAARVAGVGVQPDPDGSFALDHMPPPPTRLRPLLAGLPDGWTVRDVSYPAGSQDVELRVERGYQLRGQVRSVPANMPIIGATIHHQHGAEGLTVTTSGPNGTFTLDHLPAGRVVVRASWDEPQTPAQRRQGPPVRWSGLIHLEVPQQLDKLVLLQMSKPQ